MAISKREVLKEAIELTDTAFTILQIIKKHEPNFFRIRLCDNCRQYNLIYFDGALKKRILEEWEFRMLKEWLNEDTE